MPATMPNDLGPGSAIAFGVVPAAVPSWILQQASLASVTGGTFRFSTTRNGAPAFSLPATVGSPPAYQAQSNALVVLYYNLLGTEFTGLTGFYWVSLQLQLSGGLSVDVEVDQLTVTTAWGQV